MSVTKSGRLYSKIQTLMEHSGHEHAMARFVQAQWHPLEGTVVAGTLAQAVPTRKTLFLLVQ